MFWKQNFPVFSYIPDKKLLISFFIQITLYRMLEFIPFHVICDKTIKNGHSSLERSSNQCCCCINLLFKGWVINSVVLQIRYLLL